MLKIKVDQFNQNIKPTGFLKKKLNAPFSVIKILIDKNKITINDKLFDKDKILKEGDIIKIDDDKISLRESKNITPINLKLKEIYEDNKILVFNKPPFIAVQGGGIEKKSILNHLSYLKEKKNLKFLHPIHRIDKNTSGILIIAKNEVVLRDLNKILKDKDIEKRYLCLVLGKPKKKKEKVEVFLKVRNNEKEKVIVTNEKDKNAKYSLSYYRILETFKYKNYIFSLVDVLIKTGVTHQIRVHMKHLNTPIIGDMMYGDKELYRKLKKEIGINRQFLHAYFISFNYKGKKYSLEAKLSKDLVKVLKKIS